MLKYIILSALFPISLIAMEHNDSSNTLQIHDEYLFLKNRMESKLRIFDTNEELVKIFEGLSVDEISNYVPQNKKAVEIAQKEDDKENSQKGNIILDPPKKTYYRTSNKLMNKVQLPEVRYRFNSKCPLIHTTTLKTNKYCNYTYNKICNLKYYHTIITLLESHLNLQHGLNITDEIVREYIICSPLNQ